MRFASMCWNPRDSYRPDSRASARGWFPDRVFARPPSRLFDRRKKQPATDAGSLVQRLDGHLGHLKFFVFQTNGERSSRRAVRGRSRRRFCRLHPELFLRIGQNGSSLGSIRKKWVIHSSLSLRNAAASLAETDGCPTFATDRDACSAEVMCITLPDNSTMESETWIRPISESS